MIKLKRPVTNQLSLCFDPLSMLLFVFVLGGVLDAQKDTIDIDVQPERRAVLPTKNLLEVSVPVRGICSVGGFRDRAATARDGEKSAQAEGAAAGDIM